MGEVGKSSQWLVGVELSVGLTFFFTVTGLADCLVSMNDVVGSARA